MGDRNDKSCRVLCDGRFLRLIDDGGWEYAQRKNISGIVGMLAYTDDGKVIFVEQHRPPVGGRVIEIPAGLVGDVDAGEDMLDAARRELIEETGYEPGFMEPVVAEATISAGTTAETMTLYRCTQLRRVGDGGGDDAEDIKVHEVPLAEAASWLSERSRQGLQIDIKVYLALYFAP